MFPMTCGSFITGFRILIHGLDSICEAGRPRVLCSVLRLRIGTVNSRRLPCSPAVGSDAGYCVADCLLDVTIENTISHLQT